MPPDLEGNRYLFVATDVFSRWVEAVPMPSKESWRTAQALWCSVISRWGKPAWVTTDNGKEFEGEFEAVC